MLRVQQGAVLLQYILYKIKTLLKGGAAEVATLPGYFHFSTLGWKEVPVVWLDRAKCWFSQTATNSVHIVLQ